MLDESVARASVNSAVVEVWRQVVEHGEDRHSMALVAGRDALNLLHGFLHQATLSMEEDSVLLQYDGIDVYIADCSDIEGELCVPAFRCSLQTIPPRFQANSYFLFDEFPTLYHTNDDGEIYDTGIRVSKGIVQDTMEAYNMTFDMTNNYYHTRSFPYEYVVYPYTTTYVKAPYSIPTPMKPTELELQETPELDEFIAQFRKHSQ